MSEDHTAAAGRAAVLAAAQGLHEQTAALGAMSAVRIASALAAAAAQLRARYGRDGAPELLAQSGLSAPMLAWALDTSLATFTSEALRSLAEGHPRSAPPGPCAVVLSGNVVTAPLRALALPLLARRPVLAKTATGHDALASALHGALGQADPEVGRCLAVCSFSREEKGATQALLAHCPVVSVYGDDSTLESISRLLPATGRWVAHGHGLGAVYLDRASLADDLTGLAAAAALDVAAYDQRGCLSPQHVFVEGGDGAPEKFARALFDALKHLEQVLPRGPLPALAAPAITQWRHVAAACGQLWEGDLHAVSLEGQARLGPGYRHVTVIEVANRAAWLAHIRRFGTHLKTVATPVADAAVLGRALAAQGQAVQLSRVGEIQTPPLDALSDGAHPLAGL